MILRGLARLALGNAAGMKEFGGTFENFTTALAPLIAFPLVGAGWTAFAGEPAGAALEFISRLCAVLALPVIIHKAAAMLGKEALWLRTTTALYWAFWLFIPALLAAAFLGGILAACGIALLDAELFALGAAGGYMLWIHWFTLRAGLGLSRPQATLLACANLFAIALLTAGPILADPAVFAHMAQGLRG